MPTTGWLAGALFQACCPPPCQPGPPPLPCTSANAATGGTTTLLQEQLPCANLQHQQSGATPPKLLQQRGTTFYVVGPKEWAWRPPYSTPGSLRGTFCKHANLAVCHPASNGGATLLPSARSWQCISNANLREAHAKKRNRGQTRCGD